MLDSNRKILQEGEGYILYSPLSNPKIRILLAKEGFKIFSSGSSAYYDRVYLSVFDSVDNYGIVHINDKNQPVEVSEITKIKNEQIETQEMLDILFTAADEMFSMIDAMMGFVMTLNEEDGLSPMGRFYAAMIERNLKTIDDIPVKYKKEVSEFLK